MTNWVYVGTSELPGRTFLKPQYLADGPAQQLILALNRFEEQHGYRLTVNEGKRSRADQKLLRDEYDAYIARGKTPPYAALAAACYTSTHDEVNYGNAFDLGGPGGRVLTDAEQAAFYAIGKPLGLVQTGLGFAVKEIWHGNAYLARATEKAPVGITPTSPNGASTGEQLGAIMANADAFTIYNHPSVARHFIAGAGTYRAFGDQFKQDTGIDPQDIINRLTADGVVQKTVDALTYDQLNVVYASLAGQKAA